MCILLNDAWDLLSDEDKRKDYDAQIQLLICMTWLAPSRITLPEQASWRDRSLQSQPDALKCSFPPRSWPAVPRQRANPS